MQDGWYEKCFRQKQHAVLADKALQFGFAASCELAASMLLRLSI